MRELPIETVCGSCSASQVTKSVAIVICEKCKRALREELGLSALQTEFRNAKRERLTNENHDRQSRTNSARRESTVAEFEELKRETKSLLERMKKVLSEEDLAVTIDVSPAAAPTPATSKVRTESTAEPNRDIHKKGKTVETNDNQANGASRGELSKSQIKILKALNSIREMSGDETPERSKVAFWSGASVNSSTFANNISELKVAGYLSYPNSGAVAMADESAKHDPRFTGIMLSADTLRARQNELLSSSQTAMLDFIRSKYPADVSKEDLCAAVGAASIKSSTFANNISELKTAGLITYPKSGFVKLESWLDV